MKNIAIIVLLLGCVLLVTASVSQNGRQHRRGHRNRGSGHHNRRGHHGNQENREKRMRLVNMTMCIMEAANNNKHEGCNDECSNVIQYLTCMRGCIMKELSPDNGSPVPSFMSTSTHRQLNRIKRIRERCNGAGGTCHTQHTAACDNRRCGKNIYDCGRCIFQKARNAGSACAEKFNEAPDHDDDEE